MLGWSIDRLHSLKAKASSGPGTTTPQTPSIATPKEPPKIALALGGGAARGWAHIGVLRAFDEADVKIGMIAGTSIGALVGGCYLAGKLDELEEFARSLTMRRIAGLLDLSIGGGGLFAGMRLTKKMQDHIEGISIQELPQPFVAVASELRSGHEVWLHRGDLITALRASYALPGIFEPVRCNGRTLVDGALVNPVPVSVCRAYEQNLVVAVNLNYDTFGRSAVVKHSATPENIVDATTPTETSNGKFGLTGVMVQAFNIIQDRISRSRLAGDPPDLALQPRINDIGLSEFHRADQAIERGYEEARARIPELKRMQQVFDQAPHR